MIRDFEPIYEGGNGALTGFLLYGDDIDVFEVETFLANDVEDYYGEPIEPEGGWEVTDCYVRKVPGTDDDGEPCTMFHFQNHPASGAKKCVRVEAHSFWGHWCANHIYEPAVSGQPIETFTRDSIIWPFVHVRITPEKYRSARAYGGAQDGPAYLYFCAPCARDIRERLETARREAARARRAESAA